MKKFDEHDVKAAQLTIEKKASFASYINRYYGLVCCYFILGGIYVMPVITVGVMCGIYAPFGFIMVGMIAAFLTTAIAFETYDKEDKKREVRVGSLLGVHFVIGLVGLLVASSYSEVFKWQSVLIAFILYYIGIGCLLRLTEKCTRCSRDNLLWLCGKFKDF